MTIQDLVDWCNANNVSLDTHLCVRAKDDYLAVPERMQLVHPYFGNCSYGPAWERENIPVVDDELDYDSAPMMLAIDIDF